MSTNVQPHNGGGNPLYTANPDVVDMSNYLRAGHTLRSWLLTVDHKRIGLLYLISITFMFFLGGIFAGLIRLELMTPEGDLVSSSTYNKLFTMHGIVMVFFFLIPSIPAVLGNFLVPLMIGARDMAFPRLNLMSWYVYIIGARRRRYHLAVLHALQHVLCQHPRYDDGPGHIYHGVLVHSHGSELRRHHPPNAGARDDLVPNAAFSVGHVRHQHHSDPRHARGGHRHPARRR
jgi:hypothetical protein